MTSNHCLVGFLVLCFAGMGIAQGTKQEQKKTPPAITKPVEFFTEEADEIMESLEFFPPEYAANRKIEDWPIHPNSPKIVASIGLEKPFRYNTDMAYIIVPPDQKRAEVQIVEYPEESDRGPFPVPENTPLEGYPIAFDREPKKWPKLFEIQKRPNEYEGDRHALIVDPVNGKLYEFFTFGRTAKGWAAGQSSIFDLKELPNRPDGWTSADAAGLPILPFVVRYDEMKRGVINHALRVTVRKTRRAYVSPATHFASKLTDPDLPRMGERLRLRRDFDHSKFSPPVQVILKGLKEYGMLVADNGIDWAISTTPDPRIPDLHEELRKIKGADFEVVLDPKENPSE